MTTTKQPTLISEATRAFNIAKANLAFARSSKSEKRVTIAKDVIAAIRASWLIPVTGTYLAVTETKGTIDEIANVNEISECTACALGSVFVCALKRDTTIELDGHSDSQLDMHKKLAPYFDQDQLELIETAFESEDYVDDYIDRNELDKDDVNDRATLLGSKYEDPDQRLIAIMRNVIRNNGIFKP